MINCIAFLWIGLISLNLSQTCGKDSQDGRNYVSNICEGEPRFDDGKFHNHCTKCPGFGMCIDNYRERHCDRLLPLFVHINNHIAKSGVGAITSQEAVGSCPVKTAN